MYLYCLKCHSSGTVTLIWLNFLQVVVTLSSAPFVAASILYSFTASQTWEDVSSYFSPFPSSTWAYLMRPQSRASVQTTPAAN